MADERAAFAGQITDLPVVDLLRTISTGKKTGVARFETNLGTATVWFRDGTLVDADMGRFHMGDAVRRLMGTDAGSFEVEFKPVTRRRLIQEATGQLIDEGAGSSPGPEAKPSSSTPTASKRGPGARRPRTGASWRPTGGGSGKDAPSRTPRPAPSPPSAAASPDMLRRLEALRRSADQQPQRAPVLSATSPVGTEDPEPTQTRPTGETPQAGLEALNRLAAKASKLPGDKQAPRATTTGVPKPAPTAPAAAVPAPRQPKGTVMGLPMQDVAPPPKPDDNGWSFRDPKLAAEQDDDDDDAADRTLMRAGPIPVAKPTDRRPRRPGGQRKGAPQRVDPAEDLSDPLPIGTSWSAPAHISAPRSKPIESDRNPSAGGEIAKNRTPSAERSVVALGPSGPQSPAITTTPVVATPAPNPNPNATLTHGFRPITEAEGPGGSVPRLPAIDPSTLKRASDVAAAIGLSPTSDAPREPAPDKQHGGSSGAAQVGRYEVLLRIARGGMGTVYLCQVTGAGGFRRLFALKVIRDHLSRNDEYVRMLLQEARIASRLHHPNVVGIVDIGNLANQHYLVMDYVEGCTLSELLKVHRKTRPAHLIIPIVLDALTGLHAAHTLTEDDGSPLTLVHCDFSPQNMLLGTNGICRITDFGIARASNALPERSSITRGKPAYLAPEQVTGRPFDHRADIFAAGVVLWNALTGEQLFKGNTPEEVLDKVCNMQIPPPSSVGLRPPKKLDKVVLRALERDPARRYQTAEAMLIELRKVAITADLLAPSSDVAKWVTDTFGAQLELRRQAAGLAPGGLSSAAAASSPSQPPPPAHPQESTALALRAPELGADDSATHAIGTGDTTPADSDASHTMMLQANTVGAAERANDAVIGARARKLVLGAMISLCAGLLAVAVVRPDLLTGGVLDENGDFIDLTEPEADPITEADAKAPVPPKPEGKADGKAPGTKPANPATDPTGLPKPDPDPTPTPDPGIDAGDGGAVPIEPAPKAPAPKPKAPASKPGAAAKPTPKPTKKPAKAPADDAPKPKPKADKPKADKPKPDKPKADEVPVLPSAPNLKELMDPPMGG